MMHVAFDSVHDAAPITKADSQWTVVLLFVTGANTGLGLAASKHLATMNPAKLIMAYRSAEKGAKALGGDLSCP